MNKLNKSSDSAKALRKQIAAAEKLLARALDAIPDYMDGRHDKLCNAIDKWIETNANNAYNQPCAESHNPTITTGQG